MALGDIRERIAAILASVGGVGRVHQYLRLAENRDVFYTLFTHEKADGGKEVNAWMVTRKKTPSERGPMQVVHRDHYMQLHGLRQVQDAQASELVFQQTVEAIQNKFDSEFTLGGLAINSGPVQVLVVEHRSFGGVLCHAAELEYRVRERVTYTL